MLLELFKLLTAFIVMTIISFSFIRIYLSYNIKNKPLIFISNLIILLLILVISSIRYSNLSLSMSLSVLIGPLIGSFISGSLGVAFHFRFKWGYFYKNYLTHISLGMIAPLLLYLSMNTYFTLS